MARRAAWLTAIPLSFLIALLALSVIIQSRYAGVTLDQQRMQTRLALADRAVQLLTSANRALTTERLSGRNWQQPYGTTMTALSRVIAQLNASTRNESDLRSADSLLQALRDGRALLEEFASDVRMGNIRAENALDNSPRVQRISADLDSSATEFNRHERTIVTADAVNASREVRPWTIALLVVCLAGIIATVVTSVDFGSKVSRRIRRLIENSDLLARGEEAPPIAGSDEIAALDRAYRHMARIIRREHDVATLIQTALLPRDLPEIPGLRFDAAYRPAAQEAAVGGDWYDVFRVGEHLVGMSIGDVAGHGPAAAVTMDSARQAIRALAYTNADPAAVLTHVNTVLCNDNGALASAFFATFDTRTGALQYSIAGHPPPIIVRGGKAKPLDKGGIILGVQHDSEFDTRKIALPAGAALVLYTDGLVEATRDLEQGIAALKTAIEDEYRKSENKIASAIQNRIFASRAPFDDSAVLFLEVLSLGTSNGHRDHVWHLDARSETASKRVMQAILQRLVDSGRTVDAWASQLIIIEILGNVVKHTAGQATVTLSLANGEPTLAVCDEGPQFTLLPPHAVDPFSEGGRGLFLVRTLAQDVSVEWNGSGNCVRVQLPTTA